jgi:hypothetical protein
MLVCTAASTLQTGGYKLTFTENGCMWCKGDCHDDGAVSVAEILTLVNIALGNTSASACLAGDANGDGRITVDEILAAVNNALNGCR